MNTINKNNMTYNKIISFLKKIASKGINYEKTFYIGKSLQTGNPTPENPIPIENIIGTNGVITFRNGLTFHLSEGQKLYDNTELTPNGIKFYKKQIILSSNANWSKLVYTTKTVFQIVGSVFPNNVALRSETTKAFSNYFKYEFYDSSVTSSLKNYEFSWSGIRYFTIRNDNVENLEEWQDFLDNNNVILEYELAEPEIISYTTKQQEEYLKLCRKFNNETNLNEYIV